MVSGKSDHVDPNSIGAMIGASSLRSCVGMRFEPAAFCTFRFDKSLNTPFFVISIRQRSLVWIGLSMKCGTFSNQTP
jgi:hypothetical protein